MSNFFKQFRNGDMFPWERDFTREVMDVAIPIVIQSLFMASMHIIDNLMVGQLGEVEFAAVTQANRITFLFQLVVFGLSGSTSAFVAQYWGKRDMKGIHAALGIGLTLSLFAAVCFLIPCLVMPRGLMHLFLQDETAIGVAAQYLPVIAVGYLFTAVTQCYATVQKSTERARLPMFADIVGLAVNTFLNYCLIFGNLGFPRLGARGGAIATVIALFVTSAIIVIGGYAMRLATAAKLSALVPRSLAFARKYLSIATPVVLNEGLWSLGIVVYSVVYGRMGVNTVAAVSIFNTVEQVAMATMRGLTSACAVIVGKRIGLGDEAGAYQAAKRMLYACVPSGFFSGLLLFAISTPAVGLFNVSAEIASDALALIRLCACFLWFMQLGTMLIVGIMRSGGDVRMSLYLDAGTIWIIGVPMVALGGIALGLEIPYVYIMAQAESLVKILIGLWRFKSRRWIHNLVR